MEVLRNVFKNVLIFDDAIQSQRDKKIKELVEDKLLGWIVFTNTDPEE